MDTSPRDTTERRQVTVMFSGFVSSTALSARIDPEDLREVISAYQKCVAETVGRLGGFVAKYMGDGVLVYFGYPQAHEDDAERAVRAGLELVAAVGGLKTHAPLQTRIGIATGLVVVGDLIGSGASQEQTIVGETPNLAARLQGIAEPNTVVIAEGTRRLQVICSSCKTSRPSAPHRVCRASLVACHHPQIRRRVPAARTARNRAACALAPFLLAAAHRQRVISDHWSDVTFFWTLRQAEKLTSRKTRSLYVALTDLPVRLTDLHQSHSRTLDDCPRLRTEADLPKSAAISMRCPPGKTT